jgi:hypothetical protein
MNNVIGALQHVWAGGCGRTPRRRSIMQLHFSTSWSLNSLNPASNGAPLYCATSIHRIRPFVNVRHTFFLRQHEFNYSSLFVPSFTQRRHFHRLLQWRYLSDDRVLTHTCLRNISVAISQFSHAIFILEWEKNVGHYFVSNLRTYVHTRMHAFIHIYTRACVHTYTHTQTHSVDP